MKMNIYTAIIYGSQSASLTVLAPSAAEAAKNLWVAIHGERIGFNCTQIDQKGDNEAARDNAHAQWMGGHAGIRVSRASKPEPEPEAVAALPEVGQIVSVRHDGQSILGKVRSSSVTGFTLTAGESYIASDIANGRVTFRIISAPVATTKPVSQGATAEGGA
jgi:hypothetical protein